MKPVVGVFKSRSAAQMAAGTLVPLGIPRDNINILTPDVTQTELAQLPTQAAEQPGMGKAMGATVGGAVGLAAGTLPALLGGLLIPGVGPVLAIGLAGGVLGAVAGGVAGGPTDFPKMNCSFTKTRCGKGILPSLSSLQATSKSKPFAGL